jgi:elongation factor P
MANYINSNELKPGVVFLDDTQNYVVIKYQHIKKGRGQATIRVKVRNIETNSITEKTYSNEQKVEAADVEKRSAQYLYRDGTSAYFMDTADYSQFDFLESEIEWELNFLKEGAKVVTLFLNGKAVSIEIAKSAELKIVETTSAVPGNTATNATKDAILESGYRIQVPLFLNQDDVIRVNTEEGNYVARVN